MKYSYRSPKQNLARMDGNVMRLAIIMIALAAVQADNLPPSSLPLAAPATDPLSSVDGSFETCVRRCEAWCVAKYIPEKAHKPCSSLCIVLKCWPRRRHLPEKIDACSLACAASMRNAFPSISGILRLCFSLGQACTHGNADSFWHKGILFYLTVVVCL